MENFNFNKLWISTVELVKVTGLSRSRIFQWKKEWEEGGNDVKDMGCCCGILEFLCPG